jgi:chemotaxis regulatin CheY-phosphate phosphatase CheZ
MGKKSSKVNTTTSMVKLFEKLDDLKTIFVYGQRVIPVIQSIIDFMRETVPLLENINASIAESTNKIPKAKDHIFDVTQATELATTEILDLVDSISEDLKESSDQLNELKQDNINKLNQLDEIITLVDNPKAKEKLEKLKTEFNSSSLIEQLLEKLSKANNETYNITISLQVQDITSQQLAAVNHLIESVQERLSSLINTLDENELKDVKIDNGSHYPEDVSFDPNASYKSQTTKQKMADAIINDRKNATQEEIDKLFS